MRGKGETEYNTIICVEYKFESPTAQLSNLHCKVVYACNRLIIKVELRTVVNAFQKWCVFMNSIVNNPQIAEREKQGHTFSNMHSIYLN